MLAQGIWLGLSPQTRQKLAEAFDIPKKGGSHIIDGKLVSDGYNPEDLMRSVTIEKLQKFVGEVSTNFYELWEKAVNKVEGKETKNANGTQEIHKEKGGNKTATVGKDASGKGSRAKAKKS